MKTTNVKASDLNYDHYSTEKYDQDIINSIPSHRELHEEISNFITSKLDSNKEYKVLDLGVGTGITSKLIQGLLPNAKFDVIDFSSKMLQGAKEKLGKKNARYIKGDYAELKFDQKYDIIVSVIGIHHQNHTGKKKLFKKIHALLNPGGVFIFGDLVTYRDKKTAALNQALHFHHLVEKAVDEKTLADWAHHHYVLNDLAPIEDQIDWLKKDGFTVKKNLLKMNTALLICKK